MIKFIAGFVLAWIIIKNPSVPAEVLSMLSTLVTAIAQAFQAAAHTNAVG